MNFRISIGLVISLLVVVGGLFVVNVPSVFAAGFTLYTASGNWCPGCNTLKALNLSGYTIGGETPPDNGLIPGLFKDGQRVATGADQIQSALKQAASDAADQKLVGKDVIVGTEVIYVDPLTHEGQTFIPKPSAPQKPPTISLEKQQELAMDEANGVPITQVGGEILETHPATVNLGVEVGPGTYQVGKCQKNQSPGAGYVQPDASGNFTSCAAPQNPSTPSDSGFGGSGAGQGASGSGSGAGGSGAGGAGGLGGGLGGLSALLPLLMQGLLGGGQGNQGNLGNTSGSGQGNTTIPCSAYGTSPVCGSDGKTYTNSCYLQQYGVVQVATSQCGATTSPTPTVTPNISQINTQLKGSGAPASLLGSLQTIIAQIMATISGNRTSVFIQ